MPPTILSKSWNWAEIPRGDWTHVADEFLPVAYRWKGLSRKKILDLGCGRGRHSLFLAELGFSVTAVDLSPDGIEQLKAEAQHKGLAARIDAFVADMLEWSSPEKSFDCILAFHSIYHTTYLNLKSLIAKITKMLSDSGQLYLTLNSKDSPSFRRPTNKKLDDHTIMKTSGIELDIPHTYVDYDDIKKLLSCYWIKKLQKIEDYYKDGTGIHFFIEAEKR